MGDQVAYLLEHKSVANSLGNEARRRTIRHFIAPRHLVQQAKLILAVA
jgi:hypothetical protein